MQSVLEKLRTDNFTGIIVDRKHVDCDVLEFVLNVRDFNEEIPVFVLGQSPGKEDDKLVLTDRRTFVADAGFDAEQIKTEIKKLFSVSREK